MFNLNAGMLKGLLKTQLKTLKKIKVEMTSEKGNTKSLCRIKDQGIKSKEAYLVLEDIETKEITHLNFKL